MSNNEILALARQAVLQQIDFKYKSIGLPSVNAPTQMLIMINEKIHERLDTSDPNYLLHKKQLLIYALTYQLIIKLDKGIQANQKENENSKRQHSFKNIIEQIYLIYKDHNNAFIEMINDEKTNSLLIYIYTLDLTHHKAATFYQQKYQLFNESFLNNQSSLLKETLEFLSPRAKDNDSPLCLFRKTISYTTLLESGKDIYLNKILDNIEALDVYMEQNSPITTTFLSLALISFTLKTIENNINSLDEKHQLIIKCLKNFHRPISQDQITPTIHLKTYNELRSTAKILHHAFCIYHQHNTSYFEIIHDLAERHLTQFIHYKTHENMSNSVIELSYSIEAMITKIQYSNKLYLEWPYQQINEKNFWNESAQIIKHHPIITPDLSLRITLFIEPIILGLMKYQNYQYVLELTNLALELHRRGLQNPSLLKNIEAYANLNLLLINFKNHNLITPLKNVENFNIIFNPQLLSSDLSKVFLMYVVNSLLLLSSLSLRSNNAKSLILLLDDTISFLKKGSNPTFQAINEQLEAFKIYICTLYLINRITDPIVLPIPTAKNMKSLSNLLKDNLFPGVNLLKDSIINKLISTATLCFELDKDLSFAKHTTLVNIINFFMPLLDIMKISHNEKDELHSIFKVNNLEEKRAQTIQELLFNSSGDNATTQNSRSKSKKNKQKKLRKKANKAKSNSGNLSQNIASLSKEEVDSEEEEKSDSAASENINDTPTKDTEEENVNEEWTQVKSARKKSASASIKSKEKAPASSTDRSTVASKTYAKTQTVPPKKGAITQTIAQPKSPISTSNSSNHSAIDLSNIGKQQQRQIAAKKDLKTQSTVINPNVFFEEAAFIAQEQIPPILLSLSGKIKELNNYPLILTGNAVKTLYKRNNTINDYDCLACNISLYILKDHIENWSRIENWPLIDCRVVGIKHPILLLKFLCQNHQAIKIDISELNTALGQDLSLALLLDAKKRDLLHTTLQVPIISTTNQKLPISDPLKILPLIKSDTIELNSELDSAIKLADPSKNILSDDPIRLLRIIKELIAKPDAKMGPLLQSYLPYMQNISDQRQLWLNFLNNGVNAQLHSNQLRTKLVYLFSKFEAHQIFQILAKFKILEGITGADQKASQQWALNFSAPTLTSTHTDLKPTF